jgi:hypothetical protein
MRIGVFTTLLGNTDWTCCDSRAESDRLICSALRQIREQWITRLFALRKEGWEPLNSGNDRNIVFMSNCPPFGVKTNKMLMCTCKRAMICPFCHAREKILDPYMHFERMFYVDEKPSTRAVVGDWNLVSFRVNSDQEFAAGTSHEAMVRWCWEARSFLTSERARKREIVACQAQYGVVTCQMEPLSKRKIRLRRCGVLLTKNIVTAEQIVKRVDDSFEFHALNKERQIKKTLARVIGTTFAYPAHLMHAPAWQTKMILDAMKKLRLTWVFGFRKRKTWK